MNDCSQLSDCVLFGKFTLFMVYFSPTRYTEMDKYGREKEGALLTVKEAFSERETELQNTIRDLQSKLEDSQVEIRRLQWASTDLEKEKNLCIQKYGMF